MTMMMIKGVFGCLLHMYYIFMNEGLLIHKLNDPQTFFNFYAHLSYYMHTYISLCFTISYSHIFNLT